MTVPAVEVMECMVWTVIVRILDENHHMCAFDVFIFLYEMEIEDFKAQFLSDIESVEVPGFHVLPDFGFQLQLLG